METSHGALLDYFNKAHFTKNEEQVIRQILEAPETEQIIARAEQANIKNRHVLRQRLDSLDARHDKAIATAAAAVQKAVRAREAAEAKLLAAREEERQASAAVYAAEAAKGAEVCELRQALIASRDTRLDEFRQHLDEAKDKLRHLTRITAVPLASWTGEKSIRYETNADDVSALSVALKEAMKDIEGMALIPLMRAEVSERLTALTHKLEPMMDDFSLATPRLDENGTPLPLSREQFKLVDLLQENRVLEPGDMPKAAMAQARSCTQRQVASVQKHLRPASERTGSKNAKKLTVRFTGWRI
ncbi:hypothetical protein ACTMU2_38435 [Cupriavidus basilensis]